MCRFFSYVAFVFAMVVCNAALAGTKVDILTSGRSKAFDSIVARGSWANDSSQQVVLISLLKAEVAQRASIANHCQNACEAYFDYYSNLIEVVSRINNSSVIPILLHPEVLNSGYMAQKGLAKFGEQAVPGVLQSYQDADDVLRLSILEAISAMLDLKTIKSSNKLAALERVLFAASASEDPFVRLAVVQALSHFNDYRARSIVQLIASSGPNGSPAALILGRVNRECPPPGASEMCDIIVDR